MAAPDYTTLRADTSFYWYIGSGYPALLDLVDGITQDDLWEHPEAMIALLQQGRPMLADLFGDDIIGPAPATPAISYGHVHALGAELIFPKGGDVSHTILYDSLEAAVDGLKKHGQNPDMLEAGMIPFYMDYRAQLQTAFPGEYVSLWLSHEGPMTTMHALRGNDFFYDLYDKPDLFKDVLALITDSVIHYARLKHHLDGKGDIIPEGYYGICDDLSAMIPPDMWGDFVVPYIERYYRGLTTGKRSAHIEDLTAAHLPYLETLELQSFDPSVSPKLTPALIRDHCRVPFGWRLPGFVYDNMTCDEVRRWVFDAVTDGANFVFTHLAQNMIGDPANQDKVRAFITACKDVTALIEKGCTAQALRQHC